MNKTIILSTILTIGLALNLRSQDLENLLIIRADDMGMSHAVNMGFKRAAETGIPFNASLMVPCSWFPEAVEIMKEFPHVALGLHLTLTSEFDVYKWGPVAGKDKVPSLVTDKGYLMSSVRDFLSSDYNLEEVEIELRAQVERAKSLGLKFYYLDHHMGIARATPEIAAIVEKLAEENGVVVSRYYQEDITDVWGNPIDEKLPVMLEKLAAMKENTNNMLIFHIAENLPELKAMHDLNTKLMDDPETGESIIAEHRQAELDVFTSDEFKKALKGKNLLTYKDIIEKYGLKGQVRHGILYESTGHAKEVALEMKKKYD